MAYGTDRGLEVFSTGDPALVATVRAIEASSDGAVPVLIISGMKNSYADLRSLQDQVQARWSELKSRGIELANLGVDIRANRLSFGIIGLTPEQRAFLEEEFGADRVVVSEGQRFFVVPGSA